jgi:hypothetical protein
MNPDAIREVLALVVNGHPADSISFGPVVTIFCDNPISAARWTERTPGNLLPVSRVPVQVVTVGGAA